MIPRPKPTRTAVTKKLMFYGSIFGIVGLALYPIVISPMLNPDKYRRVQKVTRAGINQEEIQPGNMRVWSDPFDRRKKRKDNEEDDQ